MKTAPTQNKKTAPAQIKKNAPVQIKKPALPKNTSTQHQKANPTRNRNANSEKVASVSKIKRRIRDVKRTINQKSDISAEKLIACKRRLRALEFELGEKLIDEKERSNSKKYHAVKHFERKKTQRKIKQAKSALNEADDSKKAQAQEKLDELELNMKYITCYPKTLPYVSLYPSENSDDSKSVARKERLLAEIKKALLEGDSDLTLLHKKYRNDYKQKLVKRGEIAPEAPVDDVEMQDNKEEQNEADDDFFETAE